MTNFDKPGNGEKLTLMTPEPTGGIYQDEGVAKFILQFGYPDKNGIPDRMNVGGEHRFGIPSAHTGLTLDVDGFDVTTCKLTDATGAVVLRMDSGKVAASWAFESLLTHWSRKHANAVYVPSKRRDEPHRQYAYGNKVRLGCGTDPLLLLKGFCSGAVY